MNADEGTIKELESLGKRKPLSKEDLNRAKDLMVALKQHGYTVEEIAELSDGGWSVPSVKNYVRGVKVQDATSKLNLISSLKELLEKGIAFEQVTSVAGAIQELDSMGLSIGDVSAVFTEAAEARYPLKQLLDLLEEAKGSGLSALRMADALKFKDLCDSSGIGFDSMASFATSLKTYGDADSILSAINQYGSLESIQDDVAKAKEQKDRLTGEIHKVDGQLNQLRAKQAAIEPSIRLYEKLQKAGFDEGALRELETSSAKYEEPKTLLRAINAFGSLRELETKAKDGKKKLIDVETNLKQTQAEYSHLMPVIHMLTRLLYELKFNPERITQLYRMAEAYGEPLEVLGAIAKYGDIKRLEERISSLRETDGELALRSSLMPSWNKRRVFSTISVQRFPISRRGFRTNFTMQSSPLPLRRQNTLKTWEVRRPTQLSSPRNSRSHAYC